MTMTKVNITTIAAIILSVFLSGGCEKQNNETEFQAEKENHHEDETTVSITQKQYDAIGIKLGKIEEKNLTDILRANGFLKVPPQNKANVTSQLGGIVKRILVKEGDYVRRGQAVAVLSNQDLVKMQEDFLDAKSQLEYSEAEFNRQKELSENNVAAKKTFQQAESLFKSLKAKISSLTLQLSMAGIDASELTHENINPEIYVTSPVKGNVSHIDVNIGTNVDPSKTLMDVVDNSQMHIDLFVFEQDLPKISTGMEVDITLTNLPGKTYRGKIFSIGSAFQDASKSIPVHALITGDKTGLIEGMNVTGLINVSDNPVAAVPTSAIINSAGNDFIFIQMKENHEGADHEHHEDHNEHGDHRDGEHAEEVSFRKVQVKTGVSESGFTQITALSELPADADVVVNGSYYLMAVLTNEGGHDH